MRDILPIYQEDFLSEWSAFLSSLDRQSNLVNVALIYAVYSEVMIIMKLEKKMVYITHCKSTR